MIPLRRLAIISASGGAGVVLTGSALIWAYAFYSQHQRDAWNNNAITANFAGFELSQGENGTPVSLVFLYSLENHSHTDYSFSTNDSCKLLAKDQSGDLMDTGWEAPMVPIFVPAKSRVRISVVSTYRYGDIFDLLSAHRAKPASGSDALNPDTFMAFMAAVESNRNEQLSLARLVSSTRPMLAGFVLFDESHRYRIDLPRPVVKTD